MIRTLPGIVLVPLLLMPLLMPTPATAVPAGKPAPSITSSVWLNSEPLSMEALRGEVVLVEFWTFGCYNCRNVEPWIKQWHHDYREHGLVVIGVHAPEFSFEKRLSNLKAYIAEHRIEYPVAVDNDFEIWHAWHNRAWPTLYLIDKRGTVRYQRIGEGGYETTEAVISQLLSE